MDKTDFNSRLAQTRIKPDSNLAVALEHVLVLGQSVYAAAKQCQVDSAHLYKARDRILKLSTLPTCPSCGQTLKG